MLYEHEFNTDIDPVDGAFMYSFFEDHFKMYSLAVELFHTAQTADSIYWHMKASERQRVETFIDGIGGL